MIVMHAQAGRPSDLVCSVLKLACLPGRWEGARALYMFDWCSEVMKAWCYCHEDEAQNRKSTSCSIVTRC